MLSLLRRLVKWMIPHGLYLRFDKETIDGDAARAKYYSAGRLPFAPGYHQAKMRWVADSIMDVKLEKTFLGGPDLPANFGTLFDERVVEYPWVFAHLGNSPGPRLLDIGPALNHLELVTILKARVPKISITMVSPGPETNCFYGMGVGYAIEDARDLPFSNERFDQVTCISTLEHIGMDTSEYGGPKEMAPRDYLKAWSEMRRVLTRGGSMLVTVPFGFHQKPGGAHQQFNDEMVGELIKAFDPSEFTLDLYRYTSIGWVHSDPESCLDATYNSTIAGDLDYYESHPVRAEAVACLKLVK